MRSHALVHSLAQTWTQIGRNPAAALGNIAPNIGSIVAIEKDKERKPGAVFPTFLALNSKARVGPGLSAGELRALQGDAAAGGHRQHHQSRRPGALQQSLEAAALARRQPARSTRPTARRSRTTTISTTPRRA